MLDEYVAEVKKISKINNWTEDLIIRYVYYDLAKRFSFDIEYNPLGNSKKCMEMYRNADYKMTLNECMRTNKVICKSAAKILEYVLSSLGIDIISIEDPESIGRNPHVYNIITTKDGKRYSIDLQEDMYLIKMHAFPVHFGLSVTNPSKYIVSYHEQEVMDLVLGHITKDNYYTDEYLYNLKFDASYIEDFDERLRFILENIEVYQPDNIDYIDRKWYHKFILEQFYGLYDFNYHQNTGTIRFRDCYKVIDGKKKLFCAITVRKKQTTDVYIFNQKKLGYVKIDFINFAYAIKNGLVVINDDNIRNLTKTISEVKKDPSKIYKKN